MKIHHSYGIKVPIEDAIAFRSSLVKDEGGPYIVTDFSFVACKRNQCLHIEVLLAFGH